MPVWISHRGYKAAAVENTAAAFDAAVAMGFQVLETDLRLTADGHIALHHDPTLSRLFGDHRAVAAMPRRELSGRVLFLDEFMERYAACEWVFDIKPETAAGVIEVLTKLTKEVRWREALTRTTRYVTWRASHEAQLRNCAPAARYYARESECWRAGLSAIVGLPGLGGIGSIKTYSLPPRLGAIDLYTSRIVSAYKTRGARTVAFLPESDADAQRAIAVGCDEILTNGTIVK